MDTLAQLALVAALDTIPMGRVVIAAQQPFFTALLAPSLMLVPHVPLDILALFATDVSQDITKAHQTVLIVHPLTLIASPVLIVLTVTLANLATLEPPVTLVHLIITEMGLSVLLVHPLMATALPARAHQLVHLV